VALTSREVAEAYIDVHGDLSPFRKQLNKAGEDARKAGIANADKFSDGWKKRLEASMGDQWEALLDAMYSGDSVDWDRLIGKFDSKDLDAASEKIQLFIEEMREGGKLTKKQYQEVTNEVRNVIKAKQQELFVQRDLAAATQEHTDAIVQHVAATTELIEVESTLDDLMEGHTEQMREDGSVTADTDRKKRGFVGTLRALGGMFKYTASEGGKHNRVLALMSGIADKVKLSWSRTDSTVRMVMGLIAAAAGPMATLGSGLAGAGTAIASSLALGIGALGALTPALAGIAVGVGLAVSSFDEIKARVPGVQAALDSISNTWTAQADAFGRNWEGALERLLANFAAQIGKYDFGAAFGTAFANITDAFNNVVSGPGFAAFMQAMTGTIPNAVRGLGIGFAGLTGALFSFMAGAAPVAQQLGQDFAGWGQKIGEAVEKARASGVLTAVLEKMRESLLAVLDFTGSLVMSLGTLFGIGADSGNRMLASLTQIVDRFTAWMNTEAGRATMIEWFNNAETIMRSIGPLLVGLGQAMAILVTPETIAMFANLMSTVGQLLPIIAQVLAVVSQLGILNILAQLFLVVGQAIQPLLPPLMQIAGILGPLLQQAVIALAPLFNALVAAILPIVQAVLQVVGVIAPILIPAIQQIVAAVTPVIGVFGELIAFIVGMLAPILGPMLAGMIQGVVMIFQGLSTMIMGVVQIIRAIIQGMSDFFRKIFTNDVPGAMQSLGNMFVQIFGGIVKVVSGAVQAVVGFIQVYIVGRALALIRSGLTGALNFFRNIWNNISTTVSGALGRVVSFVSSGMSRVGSAVSSWMSRVGSSISSAWNSAVSFVSGAMGRIGSAVSGGVSRVMSFIGSLPGRIVGALSGLGGRLSAMGSSMMQGFVNGISSMAGRIFDAAMSAVGNAVNAVKNFLGIRSPSRLMAWMARQTWQGFILGGEAMERPLMSASEQLAATVAAGFSHMYDEGRAAAEALAKGLTSNKALVSGALDRLTPELTAAERRLTIGTGPGVAGTAPAPAGSQTVFQPGAIQFQTQVRDGKTAANQLLDVLARNAKVG